MQRQLGILRFDFLKVIFFFPKHFLIFFKKYIILGWDSFLSQEDAGISLQELISSDHHHVLDRSFTVRFRCLLDNTSGFLVSFLSGKNYVLDI